MSWKEGCPGSREIRAPYPEEITCFSCGAQSEIWSDESETVCGNCGNVLSREIEPTCIEWCPVARDCIGPEKYDKLRKGRKG